MRVGLIRGRYVYEIFFKSTRSRRR